MSDSLKANIQSFVRAGLNAFAGAWIIKHPEMGGVIEGAIIALVALVWTYVDNKKKNDEPPPPRITTTLGCIAFAVMFTGCAINRPAFTEETYKDGKLESKRTLKVTSYALWPATQEIGKQKVGMGKTFSVGQENIKEDGGSTNVSAAIDSLTRLVDKIK